MMNVIKQTLAQVLVMLALFALAVAGIDLLMYVWLELLPAESAVLVVITVLLYQARRAYYE